MATSTPTMTAVASLAISRRSFPAFHAIDAVHNRPGNQTFMLDEDGSFSPGEIRVRDTQAGLLLTMNVDQDTWAEVSLRLRDVHGTLDEGDLVL